jgi:hypothetical protein
MAEALPAADTAAPASIGLADPAATSPNGEAQAVPPKKRTLPASESDLKSPPKNDGSPVGRKPRQRRAVNSPATPLPTALKQAAATVSPSDVSGALVAEPLESSASPTTRALRRPQAKKAAAEPRRRGAKVAAETSPTQIAAAQQHSPVSASTPVPLSSSILPPPPAPPVATSTANGPAATPKAITLELSDVGMFSPEDLQFPPATAPPAPLAALAPQAGQSLDEVASALTKLLTDEEPVNMLKVTELQHSGALSMGNSLAAAVPPPTKGRKRSNSAGAGTGPKRSRGRKSLSAAAPLAAADTVLGDAKVADVSGGALAGVDPLALPATEGKLEDQQPQLVDEARRSSFFSSLAPLQLHSLVSDSS